MELTKRITISEVEDKIKELREIEKLLNAKLKIVEERPNLMLSDINKDFNKEFIDFAKENLKEKRNKILEELQENGIVEHSIEPLEK